MNDEQLKSTLKEMEKNLGKEAYAKIADSVGTLLTGNTQNLNEIAKRDKKIEELEKTNTTLITANGNLLQQVSVGVEDRKSDVDKPEEKPYNIREAFDENGNLKR